jgi:hypothetical protein
LKIDNDCKSNIVADTASASLATTAFYVSMESNVTVVRSSAPIRCQKAKPSWLDLNTG